jgi:hypothetical protein
MVAAIELARTGKDVALFEAAPALGGRTRSFFDRKTGMWVDHGPHLMTGAYQATRGFLAEVSRLDRGTQSPSSQHQKTDSSDCPLLHLQPTLDLPLWDRERGIFHFRPSPSFPLNIGVLLATMRLPGHHLASSLGLIRLLLTPPDINLPSQSVTGWIGKMNLPPLLVNDFLTPLCLGIMNEPPSTANAGSFYQVLRKVFRNHDSARLAWFRKPLATALIEPVQAYARTLGIDIHAGTPVRRLIPGGRMVEIEAERRSKQTFDIVVLALPAWARNRLLNWNRPVSTNAISNMHLWFDHDVSLPEPLIGGLGTHGQWFFNMNRMHENERYAMSYTCVVTSADHSGTSLEERSTKICEELGEILGLDKTPVPAHRRWIVERRATVLVRKQDDLPALPSRIVDIGEEPRPGDLPATIEAAVLRGKSVLERLKGPQCA